MNTPFQIFGTYIWHNASGGTDATLVDPWVTVRDGTENMTQIILDIYTEDSNDSFSFTIVSDDVPPSRENDAIVAWTKVYFNNHYKQ